MQPAVGLVERLVLEREVRAAPAIAALRPPELLEQIGPHPARIEKLLELDVGQLADLLFGVIDPALLADARADLPHDLLDVDVVGSNGKVIHNADQAPFACLRRDANSGASFTHVPRMPNDS